MFVYIIKSLYLCAGVLVNTIIFRYFLSAVVVKRWRFLFCVYVCVCAREEKIEKIGFLCIVFVCVVVHGGVEFDLRPFSGS